MSPTAAAGARGVATAACGYAEAASCVDLGCGTGLSTRFWAPHADEVVGVEPNDAMRAFAETATESHNIRYIGASAYQTGLADACADVVTAAQSMQWMRPDRVLPEIGRLLRPGGVFCAYEYFALQTPLWEPEDQWRRVRARKGELRAELGLDDSVQLWPVSTARPRRAASSVAYASSPSTASNRATANASSSWRSAKGA